MKKLLILISIITLPLFGVEYPVSLSQAQVGKIIKVVKGSSKAASKTIGKKTIEKGHKGTRKFITETSRTSVRKLLKSKGYKSYLAFSQKESRLLIRKGQKTQAPKALKRGYNNKYASSIKNISKKALSPRTLAVSAGQIILPKAAKAIKVKWDRNKGGYVPMFDSKNLSPKAAAVLLKERRKAISPYNQFATKDQLQKYDKEIMNFGKGKSEVILKENMLKAMDPEVSKQINAFGGIAAHHLVPGNDPHSKASRAILEKYKIDINGPENGIFLPTDEKSIYKGTIHRGSHNAMYSKVVYTRLKDCKSREEVIDAMTSLKHDLYNGKIRLSDNVFDVNRN